MLSSMWVLTHTFLPTFSKAPASPFLHLGCSEHLYGDSCSPAPCCSPRQAAPLWQSAPPAPLQPCGSTCGFHPPPSEYQSLGWGRRTKQGLRIQSHSAATLIQSGPSTSPTACSSPVLIQLHLQLCCFGCQAPLFLPKTVEASNYLRRWKRDKVREGTVEMAESQHTTNSLEKTLTLGNIEAKGEEDGRGWDG